MDVKKISFGFTKVKKAVKPVEEEKKDYIECLEGKAIKLKGGEEGVEKSPLVIVMQPNTMVTAADRLKKIAEEVEKCMDLPEPGTIKAEPEDHEMEASGNETLDQLAVKELLKESNKEVKVEFEVLSVPVPDKTNLSGSKEKAKPMSKDEVHLLVDLIQKNDAILNKETNARKNKEKEESWDLVCSYFNASTGVLRTKEQLKAKWDNLKKSARKRSQLIRLNKFKTGEDYIPPDETLEKVGNLLRSTCDGLTVTLSGNGVGDQPWEFVNNIPSENFNTKNTINEKIPTKIRKLNETEVNTKTPPDQGKTKKLSDEGRLERNLAIARYYDKKTEKLELEIQLLKKQIG